MRLLVLIGMTVLALAASAVAAARTTTQQVFIDKTVRFLQESQQTSGGFAEPGQGATQIATSWAVQALEGAGINPQDQARCGTDAYTFLVDHFHEGLEEELSWPEVPTTAFERELLMVDGAGTDPHDFAGYDLVAQILGRQLADGSFPYTEEGTTGESNDTIFAILALGPIHEPAIEAAIEKAREWVVGAENEDGGWYWSGRTANSEVDMTGAALQALVAAGPPTDPTALAAYEAAIDGGLEYLKHAQLPDGGFPALPTQQGESNVASTAWAVQGIWATGGNPETWTVPPEGKEPLDYMESMQQPDGHIRWKAAEDVNGIWMTAYVLPAFSGQVIPPPPAARGSALASQGEAANCVESGQGGEAKQEAKASSPGAVPSTTPPPSAGRNGAARARRRAARGWSTEKDWTPATTARGAVARTSTRRSGPRPPNRRTPPKQIRKSNRSAATRARRAPPPRRAAAVMTAGRARASAAPRCPTRKRRLLGRRRPVKR
jgi:prenyltransferase beta subunit